MSSYNGHRAIAWKSDKAVNAISDNLLYHKFHIPFTSMSTRTYRHVPDMSFFTFHWLIAFALRRHFGFPLQRWAVRLILRFEVHFP